MLITQKIRRIRRKKKKKKDNIPEDEKRKECLIWAEKEREKRRERERNESVREEEIRENEALFVLIPVFYISFIDRITDDFSLCW